MEAPIWLGVLLSVTGVCGILGAAYATFMSSKIRAELNFLKSSNEELRSTVEYERGERSREKINCEYQIQKLHDELITLRGQVVTELIESVKMAAKEGFSIGAIEMQEQKKDARRGKHERHDDPNGE